MYLHMDAIWPGREVHVVGSRIQHHQGMLPRHGIETLPVLCRQRKSRRLRFCNPQTNPQKRKKSIF
ncbi:MAG: hypothetical protein J6U07_08695 [Fibrobacter sp.]|nr:hypothetical protein [Fibrobacter sp.]